PPHDLRQLLDQREVERVDRRLVEFDPRHAVRVDPPVDEHQRHREKSGLRFSMNADAPSVCSPDSKKSGCSSSTSLRPSKTSWLGASDSSNERWTRCRTAGD